MGKSAAAAATEEDEPKGVVHRLPLLLHRSVGRSTEQEVEEENESQTEAIFMRGLRRLSAYYCCTGVVYTIICVR